MVNDKCFSFPYHVQLSFIYDNIKGFKACFLYRKTEQQLAHTLFSQLPRRSCNILMADTEQSASDKMYLSLIKTDCPRIHSQHGYSKYITEVLGLGDKGFHPHYLPGYYEPDVLMMYSKEKTAQLFACMRTHQNTVLPPGR